MPSTQAAQINALVGFMETNPNIAKNFLPNSQAKTKSNILWNKLSQKLNSLGPPERTVDGWKNVWKDYKYNLKRKMRDNKLHSSGTGGGPNKQKFYSDNEKAVIAILDLNEAVAGNSLGMHFGDSSRFQNDQPPPESSAIETEIEDVLEKILESPQSIPPTPKPKPSKKIKRDTLLEKHVQMQADVLTVLSDKLSSIENSQKEISKDIKKISDWNKEHDRWNRKMYQLKKDQFEEQKIYNKNKTKARLDLILIKSKKLELEEFKNAISTPRCNCACDDNF